MSACTTRRPRSPPDTRVGLGSYGVPSAKPAHDAVGMKPSLPYTAQPHIHSSPASEITALW